MPRRIHISGQLVSGNISLDPEQAHHLRDVLRLSKGDAVEAFDDAGRTANATVEKCDPRHVTIRVGDVAEPSSSGGLIVASALPKGSRADWMVEKLSELGVSRFIPLKTARSVVEPEGEGKRNRWLRIATESAKQSRRAGVMQIDPLTPLQQVLGDQSEVSCIFFLSTEPEAIPIASAVSDRSSTLFLIGPEGGWSPEELVMMKGKGLTGLKLTGTILRVETAAVAASAIILLSDQRAHT